MDLLEYDGMWLAVCHSYYMLLQIAPRTLRQRLGSRSILMQISVGSFRKNALSDCTVRKLLSGGF